MGKRLHTLPSHPIPDEPHIFRRGTLTDKEEYTPTPPKPTYTHIHIEVSGLPIARTASSSQNVTSNISHEKLKDWPPCLSPQTKVQQWSEIVVTSEQSLHTQSWDASCNQHIVNTWWSVHGQHTVVSTWSTHGGQHTVVSTCEESSHKSYTGLSTGE